MCRCEWTMRGFRSPETLQRFVSIFSALRNLFVHLAQDTPRVQSIFTRLTVMAEWKAVTALC